MHENIHVQFINKIFPGSFSQTAWLQVNDKPFAFINIFFLSFFKACVYFSATLLSIPPMPGHFLISYESLWMFFHNNYFATWAYLFFTFLCSWVTSLGALSKNVIASRDQRVIVICDSCRTCGLAENNRPPHQHNVLHAYLILRHLINC